MGVTTILGRELLTPMMKGGVELLTLVASLGVEVLPALVVLALLEGPLRGNEVVVVAFTVTNPLVVEVVVLGLVVLVTLDVLLLEVLVLVR